MMRVDLKQLSDGEKINLDRCYAESDRQRSVSRRGAALLAGANEAESEQRWYVLRVASHTEKDVEKVLTEAGVPSWIPMEKRVRNAPHAKRKVVRTVPAVPGYMLVQLVSGARMWAGILGIDGVLGVLGGVLGPVAVSDANLKQFQDKLAIEVSDEETLAKAYPAGLRVRVTDGVFAGHDAMVEGVTAARTVVVLVSLFGRFNPIELGLAQIEKG